MRALISAICLPLAFAALPASALTATQTVEKEILIQNPDGTETRLRKPATTVAPGERVVYTLAFTNDEAEAATNLVLTMPVPAEVTYIDGSADKPGAVMTVSTDGGNSFTPRGAATVMEGGAPVRATAADITHIRWTVAGPVAPGESDTLAFKGVLE